MGTIRWAAYRPEDINHTARAMAEAWSREPERLHVFDNPVRRVRAGSISGALFVLAMTALVAITWWVM